MDERTLNDAWGGLAFRGMLAILFGVAAVFWPNLTFVTLVYLFAGFVLASGLLTLVGNLANLYNTDASFLSRVVALVLGIVEVGVGVYLLRHTDVKFDTFVLLAGFTLVLRGLVEVVVGLFEEGGAMYKMVMVVGGLLAGVAGVLVLFQDQSDGVSFVWVLGLYALLAGPMALALALDLKNRVVAPVRAVANGRARR